mmetsp:Transcript_90554/g.125825  ORF Transcript_90554/g.125825 Transcript_90554/m.125825 type:complete len:252 (+) Transcript_90554:45-800(+)
MRLRVICILQPSAKPKQKTNCITAFCTHVKTRWPKVCFGMHPVNGSRLPSSSACHRYSARAAACTAVSRPRSSRMITRDRSVPAETPLEVQNFPSATQRASGTQRADGPNRAIRSKASLFVVAFRPSSKPWEARMALPVHTVITRCDFPTRCVMAFWKSGLWTSRSVPMPPGRRSKSISSGSGPSKLSSEDAPLLITTSDSKTGPPKEEVLLSSETKVSLKAGTWPAASRILLVMANISRGPKVSSISNWS